MPTLPLRLKLSELKSGGPAELWSFLHSDCKALPSELTKLQTLASALKMDKSWQDLKACHKSSKSKSKKKLDAELAGHVAELSAVLRQKHAEFWEFRGQVLGSAKKARKLVQEEAEEVVDQHVLKKMKRKMEAFEGHPNSKSQRQARLLANWQDALSSCVHLVPSGSGVVVEVGGRPQVLTCAHCVAADGEDEDLEDDHSDQPSQDPDRAGRLEIVVWPNGDYGLAQCGQFNNDHDTALLEILAVSCAANSLQRLELPTSKVAMAPPSKGTACVCIHNPYDWDLELSEGSLPRKNGYIPFTSSSGTISSNYKTNKNNKELGGTKHSCWTYWGSSGAPLFDCDGDVIALHNSWNPETSQRHAVSWDLLKESVQV